MTNAATTIPSEETGLRPLRLFSLDYLVILLTVLMTTGAIDSLFGATGYDMDSFAGTLTTAMRGQTENFSVARMVLLFFPFAYSAFYLFMRWKASLFVARQLTPAVLLVVLAVVSSLWSLDPDVTLRRSFNVLGGTFIGLFFVMRLTPSQFGQVVGRMFFAICVLTIVSVVLVPGLAIHHDQHYPALRGLFPHKNAMGSAMSVGFALGLALLAGRNTKGLGIMLALMAGGLGLASLSRTVWMNMALVSLAFAGVGAVRSFKSAGIIMTWGTALLLGFVILTSGLQGLMGTLASSMGRTTDLTGRTEIWNALINVLGNGPLWFGFGFESFWTSYRGALSLDWGLSGFIPYHAHNGWLQMMTDLGTVGTLMMTWALVKGLLRSYRGATQARETMVLFSFLYLVYYTIANFTEARFLMRDQFYWIAFLYAAIDPSWRAAIPTLSNRPSDKSVAEGLAEKA